MLGPVMAMMLLIAGCSSVGFKAVASSSALACPPLKEYSLNEQKKLVVELDRLKRDNIIHVFIDGYYRLRKNCREGD